MPLTLWGEGAGWEGYFSRTGVGGADSVLSLPLPPVLSQPPVRPLRPPRVL